MSMNEQVQLFKNAKIIVMPHGSSGVHTVYAQKNKNY